MLAIFILIVLGGAIGIYISIRGTNKDVFSGALVGALISVILAFGAVLIVSSRFERVWQTQEAPLVAMSADESLQGTFVFVTGSLNVERIYRYYIATPDGGYQAQSMNAEEDSVTVFEDMPEGMGKFVTKRWRHEPPDVWGEILNTLMAIEWSDYQYEFHIPEGSLVQEFRIE